MCWTVEYAPQSNQTNVYSSDNRTQILLQLGSLVTLLGQLRCFVTDLRKPYRCFGSFFSTIRLTSEVAGLSSIGRLFRFVLCVRAGVRTVRMSTKVWVKLYCLGLSLFPFRHVCSPLFSSPCPRSPIRLLLALSVFRTITLRQC